MATASDSFVLSKEDRKIVVAALGMYEMSVNRSIKSAAAPVVAEAHGKVLVEVQRVQALFR
ncbi:MAG: hypothetical protein [Microvirus sp.]|nr:MAG: hypothetical protein [Microvirus sp.]